MALVSSVPIGERMTHLLASTPAWAVAVLLAALMAGGWEIGRRTGARRRRAGLSHEIGKFGDATLALLGLLLAFTFSLALAKHDQRRALVIQESNAIGDFYTTVSMLPEPVRSRLHATIRDYVLFRLELAKRMFTDAVALEELQRSQAFHARMTELAGQAIQDGTPVVVPLTNTLNDVTSSHTARLAAFRDRLPGSIVMLLFFASVVAIALSGREQGLTANIQLLGTICFILLVSLTVFVTLDLNQPRRGLITVSQEPFENLLLSMTPK
jgi:hypothetical protein